MILNVERAKIQKSWLSKWSDKTKEIWQYCAMSNFGLIFFKNKNCQARYKTVLHHVTIGLDFMTFVLKIYVLRWHAFLKLYLGLWSKELWCLKIISWMFYIFRCTSNYVCLPLQIEINEWFAYYKRKLYCPSKVYATSLLTVLLFFSIQDIMNNSRYT